MGSENDQKLKNGVMFLPNLNFFAIFGSFIYPLKILVFLVDSRVYSKHFGILLLKFEHKLSFSQQFFHKKTLKSILFALRTKTATTLNRYLRLLHNSSRNL